jgi:hypothetical protein
MQTDEWVRSIARRVVEAVGPDVERAVTPLHGLRDRGDHDPVSGGECDHPTRIVGN